MCSCNQGKQVIPQQQSSLMAAWPTPVDARPGDQTEQVVFTSAQGGFYTVDSGNRYKSYGRGTRVTIVSSDRKALENMGLIAPL